MRQIFNTVRQLPTTRPARRMRLLLAGILILTAGLVFSAGTPHGASPSYDLAFTVDVASVAKLSIGISVPGTLADDSATGSSTEVSGLYLRLTLLPRPGVERINHSL